ncbi:uncharacterized protein LOC131240686 isoform X2 [Magnolia sinica]|uniref:uncharacterized protein LOC131240686 isoform X2 n=1 Tax=Magnolia sinica TaxID=86752 RepID=UPI002657FD16|nr:uncharacterized protein LOC131240686 isoform X2 [Magnolia sinica]
MSGKRSKSRREFTKEESMKVLFGEEIAGLHDDGFEGSNNERQIFMEVFYGNEKGNGSKRCVVTGAIHFEADESKPLNALSYVNCEHSSLTSLSSVKESLGEDVGAVNEGFGHENVKRIKLSGELPDHENREPSYCLLDARKDLVQLESSTELASVVAAPGLYSIGDTIACRLVESSSLGIISSCVLLKHHGEMDVSSGADNAKASDDIKLARSVGRDAEEITKPKVVTSPVSQESFASRHLPPDTVTAVEDMPFALSFKVVTEEPRDSDLLKSDSVNVAWKRDFIKKLRPRLREHIKRILLAAGWEIELRQRKNRLSYMDTVYITPTMKVICSLPSAWKSCGDSLFPGGTYSMQEDNGRQWTDVNVFWCDLSDTLAYIEKEMQKKKSSVSLQQRWNFLNPFVTMVFIDKKIGVLKAGRPVKAIGGVSVELNKNQDMISPIEHIDGGRNQLMEMDGDRNQLVETSSDQLGSLNEGSVLALESDSLCTQVDACLHGTPIVAESTETVAEGIENVSNHRDAGERFSISCERNHRNEDFQSICTSGKTNRKLFHDGDVCERSLKSLARSIQNGSADATDLGSKKGILSESEPKRTTTSACYSAVVEESHSEDLLVDGVLVKEPSKSQVMKLAGSASMNRTVDCRVEGEPTPLGLNVEIDVTDMQEAKEQTCEIIIPTEHNQQCKKSTIQLQMPCSHPQEENLPHGVDEKCNNKVLTHDNTLVTVQGITMLPEMESSACRSSPSREFPCFNLVDKVKVNLVLSVHQEDTILSDREMDSEGLQPSEHLEEETRSVFEASATEDASAAAPEIGLMKETQKKSKKRSYIKAVKSYHKYKKDVLLTPNKVGSQSSNFINFDRGQEVTRNSKRRQKIYGSMIPSGCNAKLAIGSHQCEEVMVEKQIPFLFLHENLCNGVNENCMKEVCAHENSFHTAKGHAVQKQSSVYNGSCPSRKLLSFNIDGKDEDGLDLLVHQKRPMQLEMETRSVGLQQFEFHEEELDITFEASKSKKEGSASAATTEVGSTKKVRKKSKKISEIKAPKSFSQHKKADLPLPPKVESPNVNFTNLDGDFDDFTHGHLKKSEKWSIGSCRNDSPNTSSVSSSQNRHVSSSKFKKFQHQGDFKESDDAAADCKSLTKLRCENRTDEAPSLPANGDEHVDPRTSTNTRRAKKSEPMDPQSSRKIPKEKKSELRHENGRKRSRRCLIDDDDLLISAIINKDFSSNSKHIPLKRSKAHSKVARQLKSQNGSCKLLLRNPGKGGKHSIDGKWFSSARTVLAWLLDTGVVSVNDVIQYRSPKDGAVIKNGRITRDGLLCKCCNKKLSVSEFKVHAGFKLQRPCLNLFLESGRPFTLCQLQGWSSEYKARKGVRRQVQVDEVDQNDDTCGLCGDGGELICCDNCPSTFHQSCLSTQELPEGNWYCPNCTCEICGDLVNEKETSCSLIVLQCSQCENKYHKMCINENSIYKEVASGTWFCGGNCQEVYLGLHSRVGILNRIVDGFSWTLLRCIHGDQKIHSAQRFAQMAECNTKLAVALSIMEESFLPMVDPRTGIDMIPHVLYNWGVHGVTLAEMPLIATCSEHRRQGMCRRLMNAIEEMLKSFKVEMLVITAIPTLVETWTSGFGFKAMSDKEKKQLTRMNLMMFPGTTLLKKTLCRIETMETEEAGLDAGLSLITDASREVGVCDENTVLDPGPQSVGIDLEANHVLQNCRALPLEEEQRHSQPKHFMELYASEPASTLAESNRGDASNIDCCSAGIENLDTCDGSRLVSTWQVASETSLGNAVGAEIHADPRSNNSHKTRLDCEVAALGNMDFLAKVSKANCMRNQESIGCFSDSLCTRENGDGGGAEEKDGITGTRDARKTMISSEGENGSYPLLRSVEKGEDPLMLAPNSNMQNHGELGMEHHCQASSLKVSKAAACLEGGATFHSGCQLVSGIPGNGSFAQQD